MMRFKRKNNNDMWNGKWNHLFLFVFLGPIVLFAQVQELSTKEEVMVIAPFNPTISKANKINFQPKVGENQEDKIKIEYLTSPKLYTTNFSLEKLEAANFIDRRSPRFAQNYVKAGFGMYTTPYVELFVNNKMSKRSNIGIHVRHLSTNGGIDNVAYSGSSSSAARLWMKHIRRNYATTVSLDYKRDQIHYYGFNPEDFPTELANTTNDFKDDINQVYSYAGIHVDFAGTFDTKQRDWQADFNYKFFWDRFNSQEHLLDVKAHYDYRVDWINTKNQFIGISFNSQTYQTKQSYTGSFPVVDSSNNYFHGLYDVSPYYHLGFESIKILIGAQLSMGLDSNSRVMVAPNVKLDVGLMGDMLKVYAHLSGGYYNNSMHSLSKANSFVSPIIPLKYTQTNYQLRAGLKGRFQSFIDYDAYITTASFKDMPMFVTDTTAQFHNSFTTIYDGGQELGFGLDLLFKTEKWNVELNGQYHKYTMDTAMRAWQKPELTFRMAVSYYVLENLKITGLLVGQSKMYALYDGEKVVDPWMDFSLLTDYHLTKKLGVFLNVTNIFSSQYEVKYAYPVQGFGIMGGVHFAF